jgi:hypothetical protein
MDCFITTTAIPCKDTRKPFKARLTYSRNASDPTQKDDVCAGPRANDVAPDDPNHSISGVNMQRKVNHVFSSETNNFQFSALGTRMKQLSAQATKGRTCVDL